MMMLDPFQVAKRTTWGADANSLVVLTARAGISAKLACAWPEPVWVLDPAKTEGGAAVSGNGAHEGRRGPSCP